MEDKIPALSEAIGLVYKHCRGYTQTEKGHWMKEVNLPCNFRQDETSMLQDPMGSSPCAASDRVLQQRELNRLRKRLRETLPINVLEGEEDTDASKEESNKKRKMSQEEHGKIMKQMQDLQQKIRSSRHISIDVVEYVLRD